MNSPTTDLLPVPGTAPSPAGDGADSNSRWNFGALIVDVTAFSIGMAFLDMSAIVPLLMARLGATGPLIGALAGVRLIAFSAPQVLVAWAMHGRARQKPFVAVIAGISRLPFLVLPVALWHADRSPAARTTALAALFLVIAIWAAGDGMGYVPWMEIVARAFTERVRGRFFATTQMLSGATSILVAAFLVTLVLNSRAWPYPHNYALLAALAAVMYLVSFGGLLAVREPPAPPDLVGPQHAARDYFGRMPGLVRRNPNFIKLTVIQLLVGFGAAATPFYVLYAKQRFGLSDAWGGRYQVMQALSVVLLSPLWTWLSERRGPATAVKALCAVCLAAPVIALTVGRVSPLSFGLIFLCIGGSLGWGMWIVFNHYLLAHAGEQERAGLVALLNLLFLPSAAYPLLGGLCVVGNRFAQFHGAPLLFLMTATVNALGLALALKLPPPGGPTSAGQEAG